MPLYKWDEIEDTLITPSHKPSRGKTIMGKHLLLQRILNRGDRGDRRGAGGKTHSHPEEQIIISLEKGRKIRIGNVWFTVEPGDIFLIPTNTEHEGISDEDHVFLSIKSRVPGHSWYDESWIPGAEEEWKKVETLFDEIDRRYKEKVPWNVERRTLWISLKVRRKRSCRVSMKKGLYRF